MNLTVDIHYLDEFKESEHPRAKGGEFASGAGGGSSSAKLKHSDLKRVGKQLGSNPGGQYEDPSGNRYYVKQSKSPDHAKNELLASKLYEAAGAPVLPVREVDLGGGKLGTATAWEPDVKLINRRDPKERAEAQRHFATHAWLANWDAAGLEYDNQGRVNGKMTTLDPGGSLLFRAQGGPKGDAFGSKVTEWDSLRQPSNAQAHGVYGEMTPQQLKQSAAAVASVSSETIRSLVMKHGPGSEAQRHALAEKLIARRNDVASRAGITAVDAAWRWAA